MEDLKIKDQVTAPVEPVSWTRITRHSWHIVVANFGYGDFMEILFVRETSDPPGYFLWHVTAD